MIKKSLVGLWLTLYSLSSNAEPPESFKFIALGDMPYSIPHDYIRFERLISRINRINPSFTVFVGDTKSGSTECSNEHNEKIKNYFNEFSSPLIYSVGDNEWTDCHRQQAGSYDPLERLEGIRIAFFSTKQSFGKEKLELIRQADIDPKHKKYVENSYWVKNSILFVNLHIPGSNNNNERDERSKSEFRERNQANLDWIKHSFMLANSGSYKGIVFIYQADMFYSAKQLTDNESGYRDTLKAFSQSAEKFNQPVLLIHGDSHKLIIDQPLKTVDQKFILENVLRLQVMGAEQVQAVEIIVDPMANQPFSFKPLLVPENRLMPLSSQ